MALIKVEMDLRGVEPLSTTHFKQTSTSLVAVLFLTCDSLTAITFTFRPDLGQATQQLIRRYALFHDSEWTPILQLAVETPRRPCGVLAIRLGSCKRAGLDTRWGGNTVGEQSVCLF